MKYIKILSFCGVAFLLIILTACGSADASNNADEIDVADISQYVLIYPENATETEYSAEKKLFKYIQETYDIFISTSTDHLEKDEPIVENSKEIVIGKTNRKDFSSLRYCDFVIERDGNRIFICGGSGVMTSKAVDYFISNYFSDKGILIPDKAYHKEIGEYMEINDTDREMIDAAMLKVPKGKSFIFITDQHINSVDFSSNNRLGALDMIKYIDGFYGVNTVISGGDLLAGHLSDKDTQNIFKTYYTNGLLKNSSGLALYAIGNHDCNPSAGTENILKDSFLYEATSENLLLSGKAVLDTTGISNFSDVCSIYGWDENELSELEAMMKLHYYCDDVENKIRYIVLDSGSDGLIQRKLNYSEGNMIVIQYKFLIESLMSVPSDYDIVVACHNLLTPGEGFGTDSSNGIVYDILSAFKEKSNIEITDSSFGKITSDEMLAFAKLSMGRYDFSNVEHNGKLFTVSGHTHGDGAYIINNQSSAKDDGVSYNVKYSPSLEINERGVLALSTRSDSLDDGCHTFDIITITETGVSVTRIGKGSDKNIVY